MLYHDNVSHTKLARLEKLKILKDLTPFIEVFQSATAPSLTSSRLLGLSGVLKSDAVVSSIFYTPVFNRFPQLIAMPQSFS